MKPYKRTPWMRNPRVVNWAQYAPSNSVRGGPTEIEDIEVVKDGVKWVIKPKNTVESKLDGKRPAPSSGPTEAAFYGEWSRYWYNKDGVAHKLRGEPRIKDYKILLEVTNQFVKVFLFYNSKECYLIEENTHTQTRFYSQHFPSKDEAKKNFIGRRSSIRWLRNEPL